ncbi:hypothetical protein EMCG_01620 [[Emmonsia] crescens]|uniref:Uncharacterized protein n=1 Tax=[Emmonsia] crescens TaxID=73230 RepID=A0A0G2I0K0_9EURO|nr:hypothetical protein EMCG_01620 [Emmonsia crescens UAMH 3008]
MAAYNIQLRSPKDWRLWYRYILFVAASYEVLNFVDIERPENFYELEGPPRPERPKEINEMTKFKWDVDVFKWEVSFAKYRRQIKGVSKVNMLIWETVALSELKQVRDEDFLDIKRLIRSLKSRLCPTTSYRQHAPQVIHLNPRKPPKNQGI